MKDVMDFFNGLNSFFTGDSNLLFTLIFFTAILIFYSVFIYYFYQFLARKNIITLNLNQYNRYQNPTTIKIFAIFFYILEYIIILPFTTFFWFSILSILILLLAEGLSTGTVLLVSASLVAGVRISSYISQTLSKDLAKVIPFTLLALAITKPSFFNFSTLLERILEIPELFSSLPYYLIFIVGVELFMRLTNLSVNSLRSSGELGTEDEEDSEE